MFQLLFVVCSMVSSEEGVVAIFGPESKEVDAMVKSVAANLEIPHISTHYLTKTTYVSTTALNIYPDYEMLATAIATIVQNMDWKTYMIIYEDNESLVKLQDVLKLTQADSPPVTIRQLDSSEDQRPLFKLIKQSGESNIILECKTHRILDILAQAKEVDLLEYFHNYFLTDLVLKIVKKICYLLNGGILGCTYFGFYCIGNQCQHYDYKTCGSKQSDFTKYCPRLGNG